MKPDRLATPCNTEVQAIIEPTLPAADRQEILDYQMEVSRLQQSVSAFVDDPE